MDIPDYGEVGGLHVVEFSTKVGRFSGGFW